MGSSLLEGCFFADFAFFLGGAFFGRGGKVSSGGDDWPSLLCVADCPLKSSTDDKSVATKQSEKRMDAESLVSFAEF